MKVMRSRTTWRVLALAAGLAALPALGQAPVPPTGPGPAATGHPGPIHRALRHTWHTIQDKFVGYPPYFLEPPLGYSLYETIGMMKHRADPHKFMLYRSDFVDGTATLAPGGAQRLTLMANRLDGWLGPLVVEWTPDRPGLAEQRRDAVLALLSQAHVPLGPERVIIGPSPDPGLLGEDAATSYPIMIQRDARAGISYPVPPIPVSLPGAGGVR